MGAASADYIMFMDQDDFFKPQACDILYAKITEENVDIVSGRWYKLFEDVKIPSQQLESEIKINNIKEYSGILGQPSYLDQNIQKIFFRKKQHIFP